MIVEHAARFVAPLALLTAGVFAPPAWALDWDHTNLVYGPDDPDRQYLNIYKADGERTPVCLYAHENGGSADRVSQSTADLIVGAGYSVVSWESVLSLASADDVLLSHADADLAFDWVRANASTYGFDPDHIVICGRSRGSVASWRLAHRGHPAIRGAHYYNALPDGTWTFPELWDPLDDVSSDSPPMFLAFGPEPNDGDIHNPVNLYPVVDRYDALGMGGDITLTEGMTADGLEPFHHFPSFVAGLDGSDTGPTEADPTEPDTADDASGCHTTASPTFGWAWLVAPFLLGILRRR